MRGDKTQDGSIRVNCYGCYSVGGHVFYSTERDALGKAYSLVVNNTSEAKRSQTIYFVPDVRWVGLLPFDLLSTCHAHPETIFTPKEGSQATKKDDLVGSRKCSRIDWVDYSGISTTAWVVDETCAEVLRVERRFSGDGVAYVDSIEAEGKRYGQIWFPVSYRFQRTENGKVTVQDTSTLSVVRLNEVIDPKVFSIDRISIVKPGTLVAWNVEDDRRPAGFGPLIWDGERIVSSGVADTVAPRSNIRSALLYINLGIIMVLLAIVLYRVRRRRGTA